LFAKKYRNLIAIKQNIKGLHLRFLHADLGQMHALHAACNMKSLKFRFGSEAEVDLFSNQ